jgi:hypothetical protein
MTSRRWIKPPPMWPMKPKSQRTTRMTNIVQSMGFLSVGMKLSSAYLSSGLSTCQAFSEHRLVRSYFPNTFFTSPTLFWTWPATFSAVPRSRRSGLPIAFPASSLIFPFASWIPPWILSVVLEFIHLIRISRPVRAGLSLNM